MDYSSNSATAVEGRASPNLGEIKPLQLKKIDEKLTIAEQLIAQRDKRKSTEAGLFTIKRKLVKETLCDILKTLTDTETTITTFLGNNTSLIENSTLTFLEDYKNEFSKLAEIILSDENEIMIKYTESSIETLVSVFESDGNKLLNSLPPDSHLFNFLKEVIPITLEEIIANCADLRKLKKLVSPKDITCFVVYAHHKPKNHWNMITPRRLIDDLKKEKDIVVNSDQGAEWPDDGIRVHSEKYLDPFSEDAVKYVIVALSSELVEKAYKADSVCFIELNCIKKRITNARRLNKDSKGNIILIQLEQTDKQRTNSLRDICPDIFWTSINGACQQEVDILRIENFIEDVNYKKGIENFIEDVNYKNGLKKVLDALHGERKRQPDPRPIDVFAEPAREGFLKTNVTTALTSP